MIPRVSFLLASALALTVVTSVTMAAPPRPAFVEPVLVGDSNGAQILDGFRVTMVPPGSTVTLQFAGTVRPYTVQVPPATIGCPTLVVSKLADAAGNVTFQARFGGFANTPAVQVRANGVFLATVLARSTDLDADGVTGIIDLNKFRQNFLFVPAALETDYDETGLTDLGDLVIFRQVLLNDIPGTPCP